MTQSVRVRLIAALILGILLQCRGAEAQSWGVTVGLSRALKHEWALGACSTIKTYWQVKRHMECGAEASIDYWRPASRPPSDKIGLDWESHGAAWLFEIGPAIRLAIRPLDELGSSFVLYGGSGLVLVSSDAELYSHVAGSPTRMQRLDLIDSRVAPYVQMGVGLLSAGDRGRRNELSAKTRLLLVEPKITGVVMVELGVAF
jgi:hypothetical protein